VSANDNDLSIMEEAADWIDRLDDLSDADYKALAAWLNASPDHAAAFATLRHALRDTALLDAVDRVRAAPIKIPSPPRHRRMAMSGGGRLALIAAGLLVLIGGGVATSRLADEHPAPPIELATSIGGRADHLLSDASSVHLNADSHASVIYGAAARDVYLRKGDAVFEVAKNPQRPFNVMAGDAKVTAVGTVFEVDRVNDAVEVRVFEGVVRVAQGAAPDRLLRRGEWLLLASNRPATRGRLDPDSYGAWRADWLDADNMPLKYVIARLNRYSADAVMLRDPALGELKVTGRFKLDRTADSLAMISALLEIDAAQDGRRIYLAPRHPPAARQAGV
jgi:transmembrane sensor